MNEETAKRLSHVKAGIDKVDAAAESLASSPCSPHWSDGAPKTEEVAFEEGGDQCEIVPAAFAATMERTLRGLMKAVTERGCAGPDAPVELTFAVWEAHKEAQDVLRANGQSGGTH